MAVEAQNSVTFKLANFILVINPSCQAHMRASRGMIIYTWLGYSYRVYGNCRLDSHCSASVNKAIQRTHTQSPYSTIRVELVCYINVHVRVEDYITIT